MSPENVLLQPLPTAPPPPPPAALPAASNAGGAGPPSAQGPQSASAGDSGEAPGTGPGGATDTGEASSGSGPSESAAAGTPKTHRGATAGASQDGKAGKSGKAGTGPAGPAAQAGTGPGSPPFAQTLALSLAAHDSTGSGTAGTAASGKPTTKKSDGAQKSDKGAKTDPVQSALTLVLQGLAGAPTGGSIQGDKGAKQGSSAAAGTAAAVGVGSNSAGGAATTAAGSAAANALLAHAGAQDAKILTLLSATAAAAVHGSAQGQNQGQNQGPSQGQGATLPSGTAVALAAAQLGLAATSPATSTHVLAAATATLNAPVGSGAWGEELGTQLTWMTNQGIQSASLQLTPAHLGPLQVSISVHNGQASVWFGATQDATRQALERSMPQLQQMFSSQGLTLTDSGVSRDSPRDRAPSQPTVRAVSAVQSTATAITAPSSVRAGLVDAYV